MNERIDRFRRQLEENPANHLARFSLAKTLMEQGEFQLAGAEFTTVLNAKNDWMVARILLGKCELNMGHYEAARGHLEVARQLAIAQDHQGPREELEELLRDLNQ